MTVVIRNKKTCNREEINAFYNFLWKLRWENSTTRFSKFKKTKYIGFYKKNDNIIGMSSIKKPSEKWITKINISSWKTINKDSLEYGYVYVSSRYRGQWITKKIYIKLEKKINYQVYATTKEKNIPMRKILEELGYKQQWSFKSIFDWGNIIIYGK
jgi:RimJ/RimL family protein N-acetyltransferase